MKEIQLKEKVNEQNLFFVKLYLDFKKVKNEVKIRSKYINGKFKKIKELKVEESFNEKDNLLNNLLSENKANFLKGLEELKEKFYPDAKTNEIIFNFDGQGDSGELYDIEVRDLLYNNEHVELEYNYFDIISQRITFDWYNNDGGYGEIIVNLDTGIMYQNGNVRITDIKSENAVLFN